MAKLNGIFLNLRELKCNQAIPPSKPCLKKKKKNPILSPKILSLKCIPQQCHNVCSRAACHRLLMEAIWGTCCLSSHPHPSCRGSPLESSRS